jgi:hypothetical protein
MVRCVLLERMTRGMNDSVVSHQTDRAEDNNTKMRGQLSEGARRSTRGCECSLFTCDCSLSTCESINSHLQGIDSDLRVVDSDLRIVDSDLREQVHSPAG